MYRELGRLPNVSTVFGGEVLNALLHKPDRSACQTPCKCSGAKVVSCVSPHLYLARRADLASSAAYINELMANVLRKQVFCFKLMPGHLSGFYEPWHAGRAPQFRDELARLLALANASLTSLIVLKRTNLLAQFTSSLVARSDRRCFHPTSTEHKNRCDATRVTADPGQFQNFTSRIDAYYAAIGGAVALARQRGIAVSTFEMNFERDVADSGALADRTLPRLQAHLTAAETMPTSSNPPARLPSCESTRRRVRNWDDLPPRLWERYCLRKTQ